ncbi:MAG: hypothetical protein J6C15_07115 [Bacteroidaceae bacterium]|nr:hypothetical protein [Bacteroidaceae bacterium]
MKKIFSILLCGCLSAFTLTSCMDEHDDPNTDDLLITSPVSIGEVNTTILDVKTKYCASSSGAEFVRNSSNFFSKVTEDLIIEGVVVGNDISGNLYQTVLLRNIDSAAGTDQCIVLAVKNTCLYPYFPLGQRLKVNLKGLYAGCYSKVPKIGQPYYTSNGNMALGPMLIQMCATNVELVGNPDLNAQELVPVDFSSGNLPAENYKNAPMLATVKGTVQEVQGAKATEREKGELSGDYEPLPKIFAPEALYDAGYGVDRTLLLSDNKTKVTIRTSTQNDIAFTIIPKDERSYTGMFSYYSGWQVQLRSLSDIQPMVGTEESTEDSNK